MSRIAEAVRTMRHRNHLRLLIRGMRLIGHQVAMKILTEQLKEEEQADRDILKRAQYRRNAGNRTMGRW